MTHSAILRVSTMRVTHPSHVDGVRRAFIEWEVRTGRVAEVVNCVVDDRRKGIGRALVEEMVRLLPPDVKTVYAWTRGSNFDAQDFWEAVGFVNTATVEGFYGDGRVALERAGVLFVRGGL
jgi:GNAT superfamily N-acetyltransferase